MDHVYSTTTEHQKGKHLLYDERILIQVRLKDGWSANKIAKEIGCAPNTVRNEIKRGTVTLYNGRVQRYKAKAGQAVYDKHRSACGRHFDKLSKALSLNMWILMCEKTSGHWTPALEELCKAVNSTVLRLYAQKPCTITLIWV